MESGESDEFDDDDDDAVVAWGLMGKVMDIKRLCNG
jgi:hypothetical protein